MTSTIAFFELATKAITPEVVDEAVRFMGIKLINISDFLELMLRFLFNMTMVIVLVRYLYYPITRRKDYLFTYILISATVFLLCFLLESVKIQLGFALGLFAIFGIIRYRTDAIPIKEMTYLFIVIGLSVINALANKKISHAELLFTNLAILAIVYGLERLFLLKHESSKVIDYEKIDLIKPERYPELISDLEERTGLTIRRAEVGKINFLQDSAKIIIYYFATDNKNKAGIRDQNVSTYTNDDDD